MVTQVEASALFDPRPVGYPIAAEERVHSILEVGSGPGVGTLELVEVFPQAHITCLEPGDVPRAALVWRLRDRGLLGPESTLDVLPLGFAEAGHLGNFDLIVAHHVVCQFDALQREEFWQFVHAHLAPGGRLVIDSHIGPARGSDVDFSLRATAEMMSTRLERWFGSEPASEGAAQSTRSEYVLRAEDGAVLATSGRERTMDYFDPDLVMGELARARLALDDQGRWWSITPAEKT